LQNDSTTLALVQAEKKEAVIAAKGIDSAAKQNAFGSFASFSEGKDDYTILENEELKLKIANKGGRPYQAELKNYKRSDGSPLVLFDGDDNDFSYGFATRDAKAISTKDLYFTPVPAADGKSITMQLKLGENQMVEHYIGFLENQNMVDFKINLIGMNDIIAPNNNFLDLSWKQNMLQQEKTHEAEKNTTTIYYRYPNEDPDYISETKDLKEDIKTPLQWISYKQQYFNSSLIGSTNFENAALETKVDESKKYIKTLTSNIGLTFDHSDKQSYDMQFYFGPNHYKSLSKVGVGLEQVVPMGWGIFGWVNKFLVIPVFNWLDAYGLNYGIVILFLTLIIKLILLVLLLHVLDNHILSIKIMLL
jgi:YidC/Oxa1 family membrane protein insertase